MKLKISNLLLCGVVAFGMMACGGGGGSSSSSTKKTVTGVALKADGTAFNASAKVLAVDANGNAAEGTVDASGNYTVTLTGVASSGKKGKLVDGNIIMKVSDGTDDMSVVVASDANTMNFNIVTSAASRLVLAKSSTDLSAIFTAVKAALAAKGTLSADTLLALTLVESITKATFKETATSVVIALFGTDSAGDSAIDVQKLITGSSTEKEVVMIKAAATVTENILDSVFAAVNNPDAASFLLNNPEFYAAVGADLVDNSGTASATAFSDFLNSVLQSDELKEVLKELATQLDAYVTAVEAAPTTTFTVTIPEVSVAAPTVIITVARSSDTVTYSVDGGVSGDLVVATMAIASALEGLKAVIIVPLTFNGSILTAGTASITVTTGEVTVTVKNTASVSTSTGSVNLATALAEAKAALTTAGQDVLAASVPSSTSKFELQISGSPVVRSGVSNVSTFIKSGSTSVSSANGVSL